MFNITNGLNWSYLYELISWAVPALICIVFHELSHGFVAYKLGDETAKSEGRLSLNPLRHIDILGLLMLIAFRFGWAKPVSVNMYNFKNPKRDMAITAIAGPVSNIILSVAALLLYWILKNALIASSVGQFFLQLLFYTSFLSIRLGFFNIIPIPPLDGSKVLFSILPNEYYIKLMRYERFGMFLLFIILFSGKFNYIISIIPTRFFIWLCSIFGIYISL